MLRCRKDGEREERRKSVCPVSTLYCCRPRDRSMVTTKGQIDSDLETEAETDSDLETEAETDSDLETEAEILKERTKCEREI